MGEAVVDAHQPAILYEIWINSLYDTNKLWRILLQQLEFSQMSRLVQLTSLHKANPHICAGFSKKWQILTLDPRQRVV